MVFKVALSLAIILSTSSAIAEERDFCTGKTQADASLQKPPVEGAQVAGDVCLLVTIGNSGTVQDVELLRGFNREADKKAIKAVRRWKFDPAKKDGRPVAVKVAVLVTVWRGPDGFFLVESNEKESK